MKHWKLTLPILVLFIATAGVIIRVQSETPPEAEVSQAGKILNEAQRAGAPRYAVETYQVASVYYDSAMLEWRNQNDRFLLSRSYTHVMELAEKSIHASEASIVQAGKKISSTQALLELRIETIGDQLKSFEDQFGHFPVVKEHRDELSRCKLLYSESLQAYKHKNYASCKTKLDSVEIVITKVSSHYQEKLSAYFEEYPKWEKLVKQSVQTSRKHQIPVIVIDKFHRELMVYQNGKVRNTYRVELGANWVGNKLQQGDKSTPEGRYRILDKKMNGETKYHKAFLLDYPNEEDKKRFTFNKKQGTIARNARIGNLIEIHGDGGKGTDWTDGCIALSDTDMDELYSRCPVGTEVTIVGSTKSFNELSFPVQ